MGRACKIEKRTFLCFFAEDIEKSSLDFLLTLNNFERYDADNIGNIGNLIDKLFGYATNNILYLLQSSRLHLTLSSFFFRPIY